MTGPPSGDPPPRVPARRPYFPHPRAEHSWRNNYPSAVLYMTTLLGLLVLAGPFATIVLWTTITVPARAAISAAPLLAVVTALVGLVQLLKRRNGGRAPAFVLAIAALATAVLLVTTGAVGLDPEDELESLLGFTLGFGFLILAVFQPFRPEAVDWFAKPLGHYEGEGDELRAQIPLPLALALTCLWICIGAIAIGAPALLANPEMSEDAGLTADPGQMRAVLWALLAWAALQAVLCLLTAGRSGLGRRLTAASALAAVPAGIGLGLLARQWTGSPAAGTGTGVLIAAGGLACWVLVTLRPSVEWAGAPLRRPR